MPCRVQPIPPPHPAAWPGGFLGRQTPRGAQRWPKKLPGTLLPHPAAPRGGPYTRPVPATAGPLCPLTRPSQHGAARRLLEGLPLSTLSSVSRSPQPSSGRLQGPEQPPPGSSGLPEPPTTAPQWGHSSSKFLLTRVPEKNGPSKAWPLLVTHTHSRTAGSPAECQPPDSGRAGTPHTAESQAGSPWAVPRVPGAPEQAQAREGRRRVPWRRGPY